MYATACIQLGTLFSEDDLSIKKLSENLTVSFINGITIARQLVIKSNAKFRKILRKAIESEQQIYDCEDEKTSRIYTRFARNVNRNVIRYLASLSILFIQFCVIPAITDPVEIQVNNNRTKLVRALPLPLWFPFDQQKHYTMTYFLDLLNCCIAGGFLTCTDLLMVIMIAYPLGQLKIVQTNLENFEIFKRKFRYDGKMNAHLAFIEIIKKHYDVIEYINDFNDIMALVALIDFLQSSIQVACVFTQILGSKVTFFTVGLVFSFFMSMIVRVFLYYYYANKVTSLSLDLAYSIWTCNWYEQPTEVIFMMRMFIMRCQKPLNFKIGSFGVMSMQAFLSVLRATYSYMMLMYGVSK
ncbi:hypothetical protein ABEB36_005492 [Hypothenemus hampei]|uniref:Odorant receptor n=1 Tax=Hypothenemus hampei TaxID=57062 RepID=A0ABD1EYE4_HYPHA